MTKSYKPGGRIDTLAKELGWDSGGAYGEVVRTFFAEGGGNFDIKQISRGAGISQTEAGNALEYLERRGLVQQSGGRYFLVNSPTLKSLSQYNLERFKEEVEATSPYRLKSRRLKPVDGVHRVSVRIIKK